MYGFTGKQSLSMSSLYSKWAAVVLTGVLTTFVWLLQGFRAASVLNRTVCK